jgi:lactoylglutathione lyase
MHHYKISCVFIPDNLRELRCIYETCQRLKDAGIVINRPPRDGHMAFIRSPDNISIELLQRGKPLPQQEPWISAENIGHW